MAQIFRIAGKGDITPVAHKPFINEVGDLEDFIKRSPEVLGEGVKVFAEQVDTGTSGRIDLLAVELTPGGGQLLLVELKAEPANVAALLQVLRYASWTLANPDSVRLLLERAKIGSEQIELRPKLVIVAPVIESELAELAQYISGFEFDLVEIERFADGADELLIVNRRAQEILAISPVRAQEEWNWEKFESSPTVGWSKENVATGQALFDKLLDVCQTEQLSLEPRFRKNYVPFQYQRHWNAFGVEQQWANGCAVWFRASTPPDLQALSHLNLQQRWVANWNQQYVNVDSLDKLDEVIAVLRPRLVEAYAIVTANR